jgi:hypothetical protein
MWQIYGLMARDLINTRRREAAAERRARRAVRRTRREEEESRLRIGRLIARTMSGLRRA